MSFDRSIKQLLDDTTSLSRAAVLALLPSAGTTLRHPVSSMLFTAGAVAPVTFNGAPAYPLAASGTTTAAAGAIALPSSWNTVTIAALFVSAASGFSGDVRLRATYGYNPESGGGTSQTTDFTHTMITNAAQVAAATIATGVGANSWWTTHLFNVAISRLGDDAADTFTPPINLLALRFTKAS